MQWNPNISMRKIEGCQWVLICRETHKYTTRNVWMMENRTKERKKRMEERQWVHCHRWDNVNSIKCFASHCTALYAVCLFIWNSLRGYHFHSKAPSIMANKYLKIAMRRTPISFDSARAFQLFNFIGIGLSVGIHNSLFECSVVYAAPIELCWINELPPTIYVSSIERIMWNGQVASGKRKRSRDSVCRIGSHSCGHVKYSIHILHTVLIGSEELQHISVCVHTVRAGEHTSLSKQIGNVCSIH